MKLLQNIKSGKKGFTLIEIVIVLAIAALILVIVFLAVGGAQRSQRDNASQDAAGKVIAAFSNYISDNGGTMPGATAIDTATAGVYSSYLKNISDGAGTIPTLGSGIATKSPRAFLYNPGGTCSGGAIVAGSTTVQTSTVVVAYYSETAGKSVCKSI